MFFTKFSIKLFCENYCAGQPLYITYYFSIRYTPTPKKQKHHIKKNTGEASASKWVEVINLIQMDEARIASGVFQPEFGTNDLA